MTSQDLIASKLDASYVIAKCAQLTKTQELTKKKSKGGNPCPRCSRKFAQSSTPMMKHPSKTTFTKTFWALQHGGSKFTIHYRRNITFPIECSNSSGNWCVAPVSISFTVDGNRKIKNLKAWTQELVHLVKQKLVEWSNFPEAMVLELLECYDVSLQ